MSSQESENSQNEQPVIDSMSNYLNSFVDDKNNDKEKEHTVKLFKSYIEEGYAGLTKEKAQLAQEKLFEEWDIDLTSEQEQRYAKERFEPAWQEIAGKYDYSKLNPDKAAQFIMKTLSLSDEEK